MWTVAPLVLLHTAIAHKEPRFLMPVLYFIGPLLAVSVQASPDQLKNALGRWRRTLLGRASVAVACAVNIALLAVTISIPANDTNRLDRWLWEQSRRGDVTLYAVDALPFHGQDALTNSFYVSPRVRISRVETPGPLLAAVGGGPAYVYYTGVDPPALVAHVGACTPVLRTFPEWLGRLTSFSTVFDVHVGTVCRLERRPGSGRSSIEPATRS
jgi:hypothetical protein